MQTFFTTVFGIVALGASLFCAFGCGVKMSQHASKSPVPSGALGAFGFSLLFATAAVVLLLVRP